MYVGVLVLSSRLAAMLEAVTHACTETVLTHQNVIFAKGNDRISFELFLNSSH